MDGWVDGWMDRQMEVKRDNEWMMVDDKWIINVGMDVEMGGWMDGKWMLDEWTDQQIEDEWMDKRTTTCTCIHVHWKSDRLIFCLSSLFVFVSSTFLLSECYKEIVRRWTVFRIQYQFHYRTCLYDVSCPLCCSLHMGITIGLLLSLCSLGINKSRWVR